MRKLLILAALLSSPAFALTCPSGFVEISQTGVKNAVTGANYTGQLTVTRTYNDSSARGDQQTLSITDGAIDVCIAGGNYTVRQRGSGSSLTIAPVWTVPSSGGPYTIPDVEGSGTVTPQTSVALAQLSGSNGVVKVSDGHGGVVSGTASDCVKVDGSSGPCGSGSGTVTSVTADAPLTGGMISTSGHIGMPAAGVASDGYLTQGDYNIFNTRTASGFTALRWYTSAVTLTVGAGSHQLAFDGRYVWVSNRADNTVTKIAPDTAAIVGTYAANSTPNSLVFDGTYIWVNNRDANTITKIMASTGVIAGTYPVGNRPLANCFDGTNVWVANANDNTVTKILASDGSTVGTYAVGLNPQGIAFDGANIWVTNMGGGTVTVISAATGSPVATYAMGTAPYRIVFDGTSMWIGDDITPGFVYRVSITDGSILQTVAGFANPQRMYFDGTYMWVINSSSSNRTLTRFRTSDGVNMGSITVDGANALQGIVGDGVNIWVSRENLVPYVTRLTPPAPVPADVVPLLHGGTGASTAANARTNLGLGGAAVLNVGTTTGTVAAGDDSRLSNARTPTAHASTHQNGGSDEIATATPGANAIPKAGAGGTLASGWIPISGTGLLRNGLTASELSGDVTTSGSNAVTVTKINGTSLAGLATGILKNTTATGVPSIAVAADFPTLNQNTTGTAAALTNNPTDCSAGQYATTIAANGNLTCAQVAYTQVSGTPTLAAVATSGSASDLSAGTLAAARGGAGTISGALKGNGSGVVSQAACADLSNAAASCSTDATNANNISTGTLPSARLATPIRAGGFSVMFRGSDATAGTTLYLTIPYACTITDWVITGDSTATIKLWRVADGGTALPTVSNTLSTSGFSLATGTRIHSTTLTDLSSTAIAAYDTFGINLFASASTHVEFTLGCQR